MSIHVLPLAARVGPSQGHEHAIRYSKEEASKRGHSHVILLGSKANPLPAEEKKKIFQKTFRGHRVEIMHPNIVDHVGRLAAKHKEVHVYASDDEEAPGKASRHEEYGRMFKHLPNVQVHPIARVKDTSGNEFRGRHMRQAAESGDFGTYKKMFAKSAGGATVRDAYRKVRQHLAGTIKEGTDDAFKQHTTFLNKTLKPITHHLKNISEPKSRPDGGHETVVTLQNGDRHKVITTGGKGYVLPHNEHLLTPQKGFMGMNKRTFHEEDQLDETSVKKIRAYQDKAGDESYLGGKLTRKRYRGSNLANRALERKLNKAGIEEAYDENSYEAKATKHISGIHNKPKPTDKDYRDLANRNTGLLRAAKRPVKPMQEARKSSTGSDASEDPHHIIMDLRKAAKNHLGGNPVKWADGRVSRVHPTHIDYALRMHDELKKAGHPRHVVQNYIKRLGTSEQGFYGALSDAQDYLKDKSGKK